MITIRLATAADADAISRVVVAMAKRHITPDFSAQGSSNLLGWMTPSSIANYIAQGFRYQVAETDGQIVGVVATRDNSHVYHLFVDDSVAGQGLGRRLWEAARWACVDAGHHGDMTVSASRYARGFYVKLGFVGDKEEERDGVLFTRMVWRPN